MPYQYLNSIHFVEYLADIHDNFIKNLGINTDGIIGNDNEEQKLKLITTRYTEKKLSNTKSETNRSKIADEFIYIYHSIYYKKIQNYYDEHGAFFNHRKGVKSEKESIDEIFSFLKDNCIKPSPELYSQGLSYKIRYQENFAYYIQSMIELNVELKSEDKEADRLWSLIFNDINQSKIIYDAAKLLSDLKIYPNLIYPAPYYANSGKNTTIFHLVTNKRGVMLLGLLPEDKLKKVVNFKDKRGRTPMHDAVNKLIPELVEKLIFLGADKNPVDNKGLYPVDTIKRKTNRVENIARINELLDFKSNRSPTDIAKQSVETFDVSLMDSVINSPEVKNKLNDILFDVLKNKILNSQPSTYKKLKKRKSDLAMYLLDKVELNYKDSNQNNYLHTAIQFSCLEMIEKLIKDNPSLIIEKNLDGLHPHEVKILEDVKQILWNFERHGDSSYNPNNSIYKDMKLYTGKKVLNIFKKNNIKLSQKSLPDLASLNEGKIILDKYILSQEVKNKNKSKKGFKI